MRANTIFPTPDHDHAHCLAVLMARAEQRCAECEVRLTPQRRRVLEIIAASHAAIGAYDILGRLGRQGHAPAPVSVYRALEFLRRHGLVHRASMPTLPASRRGAVTPPNSSFAGDAGRSPR